MRIQISMLSIPTPKASPSLLLYSLVKGTTLLFITQQFWFRIINLKNSVNIFTKEFFFNFGIKYFRNKN